MCAFWLLFEWGGLSWCVGLHVCVAAGLGEDRTREIRCVNKAKVKVTISRLSFHWVCLLVPTRPPFLSHSLVFFHHFSILKFDLRLPFSKQASKLVNKQVAADALKTAAKHKRPKHERLLVVFFNYHEINVRSWGWSGHSPPHAAFHTLYLAFFCPNWPSTFRPSNHSSSHFSNSIIPQFISPQIRLFFAKLIQLFYEFFSLNNPT